MMFGVKPLHVENREKLSPVPAQQLHPSMHGNLPVSHHNSHGIQHLMGANTAQYQMPLPSSQLQFNGAQGAKNRLNRAYDNRRRARQGQQGRKRNLIMVLKAEL